MALVADDPVVRAGCRTRVGAVVSLIDRGDAEAGARLFVEEVALGPGAWELMLLGRSTESMTASAGTFVGGAGATLDGR